MIDNNEFKNLLKRFDLKISPEEIKILKNLMMALAQIEVNEFKQSQIK